MIDNLYPIISNIDELVAIFIADENGKIIQSSQKHDSFHDFEKVIKIINDSLSALSDNIYRKKNEIIIFFEMGTLYLKALPPKQIYLILNTSKPSAFSCFAVRDLLKKIESQIIETTQYVEKPETSSVLLPLSIFHPVVDVLSRHYGPAAKLMVKKALKLSNATSEGIYRSKLETFDKMIENEIIDIHLRSKIMKNIKELLRNYY
jgi:hypothetical protein